MRRTRCLKQNVPLRLFGAGAERTSLFVPFEVLEMIQSLKGMIQMSLFSFSGRCLWRQQFHASFLLVNERPLAFGGNVPTRHANSEFFRESPNFSVRTIDNQFPRNIILHVRSIFLEWHLEVLDHGL